MKRLGLAITLGVAAVIAAGVGVGSCGGGTTQTPTCAAGAGKSNCPENAACSGNLDCVAGLTCSNNKCTKASVCTADSACPMVNAALCSTAGSCVCLDGTCQLRGCSSNALCQAGQICIAGKCEARPASTGLKCVILTPSSVVRQGQTLTLTATATNANGANIAGQSFTFTSSNTAAATVDGSGVVTGGTTTGVSNVTCTVTGGDTTASAPVAIQNYANPAAGSVRVIAVDERTGLPIQNAQVVVMQGLSILGGVAQATAADGSATFVGTGAVDVHVFKGGYTYVSIMGINKTDVLVPLNPTPDQTRAGGFKGTFDLSQVTNRTDTVEFGLAGASLAGPFIDLDFNKLIGESIKRRVKIGSIYDSGPEGVGLPSGLYLKLGEQSIKGDYQALADSGKRHAWGLGGKVPFDKLIQILTPILGGGGGLDNLPLGQIIASILPFFDKFRHFIKTDLNVVETARVPDTMDINGNMSTTDLVPDFNNATAFPTVNAVVSQSLSLSTAVTIPTLPRYDNKFLEAAIVLSGANVVGRGLVPLGLSAGVDAPKQNEAPDGMIDVDANTAGNQNTMNFRMAPLHSGVEGSKYFVAVLALSLNFDNLDGAAVSGIIAQPTEIGTTTTLSGGFLGFPEGASFNLQNRTFTLGTAVNNATFYRADFKAADGDWVVYFKAPASGAAFTLPATLPSAIADRAVRTTGCSGGAASCTNLRVFSMTSRADGATAAPSLDDLAGFGTTNLRRLNDFVGAFSNVPCQASGSCAPPTE